MPISATGTSTSPQAWRRSRGFSLLELLVVVTIIAIFAGAAVLSIGVVGRDREIEQEALRLQSLIELVKEEALMQSRDYGILFNATGYRFYVYDHLQALWLEPAADRFLAEHTFPEPLNLSLTLEDRDLVLEQTFTEKMLAEPEPQVVILASGELTPFEAALYRQAGAERFLLTAALDGSVEISQDERTP